MADGTHIEWTDATWNPITGCSVVSAGCKHCYAMKLAGTRLKHDPSRAGLTIETNAGPVWNGEVRFNEKWLDQPSRWGRPRRIFVCAHGDLFHEAVPDEWIDRVFAVMASAEHHQFQVLTKRPGRMLEYLSVDSGDEHRENTALRRIRDLQFQRGLGLGRGEVNVYNDVGQGRWPLPNVWLGVSVENQAAADERIPLLLRCPAAVRWISAEPLLGAIDLRQVRGTGNPMFDGYTGFFDVLRSDRCAVHARGYCMPMACGGHLPAIDWVVAGGESGAGARPMHPDWARSLRDQCAAAGVPFLFKQWGAWAPTSIPVDQLPSTDPNVRLVEGGWSNRLKVDRFMRQVGKKAAGRLLDGVQHDGYPEVRHAARS